MKINVFYNEKKKTTELITEEEIIFPYVDGWHVIPVGFVSDGCSCPKFLWPFISPQIHGKTLRYSVIHDWLFVNKLGFFKSNYWYFKMLKFADFSLFKRILVLIGLTLFGWTHYFL